MSTALLRAQLGANALIRYRVAWGADPSANPATWTWTDITTDVCQVPPAAITPMGRSDWASKIQSAGLTFRVNNPTGMYSKGRPSPNYPNVRENVPVQLQVSLNNGANWTTLFQGEIKGFTLDNQGNGAIPQVVIRATGRWDRLANKAKLLRSPLARAILGSTAATLRQYWPCEDGAQARQAANLIPGQPAMAVSGTVRFAAHDPVTAGSFPVGAGSDKLPNLNGGGSLAATFPAGSASAWTVQVAVLGTFGSIGTRMTIAEWVTPGSTVARWRLKIDPTGSFPGTFGTHVVSVDSAGTETTRLQYNGVPNVLTDLHVDATQSGGNISVRFKWAGNELNDAISASFAGTLAGITSMTVNPNLTVDSHDLSGGHVRVWDGNTAADFYNDITTPLNPFTGLPNPPSAWQGFYGENLVTRLTRLCAEESVPIDITGTSDITMGVQRIDTLANLILRCESTDMGVLGDGRGPGLYYITREARYSLAAAMTIDVGAGQLSQIAPVDDTQRTANLVTATNDNGSSAVFERTDGPQGTDAIGPVTGQQSVNVTNEGLLPDIAAWVAAAGTTRDPYRYPKIGLDFKAAPSQAASWLACQMGAARLDLTNVDSAMNQHPAGLVSLMLEGSATQISPQVWKVTANCSPFGPWRIAKVAADSGDTNEFLFRVAPDLGAITVNGSYAAGSLSIVVNLLSAIPGNSFNNLLVDDLPLDLDINGWRVTMTNYALPVGTPGSGGTQQIFVNALPGALSSGDPVDIWDATVPGL